MDNAPVDFNWEEHHMRFRRQFTEPSQCQPNGTQYVLFLLDTSGSIGEVAFRRETEAISKLIRLFCKPIKVAVMTFDHEFNLEFCFNCHDNTCTSRATAAQAIRDIMYRGGSTHTAGATKCACNLLLSETCGLDTRANCISVVYITDGYSNDPILEICKEVSCLHNRFGVSTVAIGINNFNETEIQCIVNGSHPISKFAYTNFEEFETSINTILDRLIDPHSQGQPHRECRISVHPPRQAQGDRCMLRQ